MKYITLINQLTAFIDNCEDSVLRMEIKELLSLFRYEMKYSKVADTSDLKSLYRRATIIINTK